MQINPPFDEAGKRFQQTRISHWDAMAQKRDHWRGLGGWYHKRLEQVYRFHIPLHQRVLEIGCGMGNLLAALQAAHGVGVDFSTEMICRARKLHPELEFHQLDVHDLSPLQGPFDVIIFSDTVNDLWDVQRAFEQVRGLCSPHTRVIINFYNHLWQTPLTLAQRLNLASSLLTQNWLTREDIDNMLRLAGFESIRSTTEVLWPLPLGRLANRYLVRFWPFRDLALSTFVIARPAPQRVKGQSVSVIVPARNEAGNINPILSGFPVWEVRPS